MKFSWRDGNRVDLLENGEAYFPRVFEAMRGAEVEVLVETFILFEDKVGEQLRAELIAAAQRGVRVELTVDGFGSASLSGEFIAAMTTAGVRVHMFDPQPRLLGLRTNMLRRMHRKLVVIDSRLAFVGGINFSADHLADFGPEAKQDYAMEVEGPVVQDIHRYALLMLQPRSKILRRWLQRTKPQVEAATGTPAGSARALFVVRDNRHHRKDIERHYLKAIRGARQRVVIATAYFAPSYRLLRAIRDAARRGVQVQLILQGEPDMAIVRFAARIQYDYLMGGGVHVLEYCRRPLHGKVALVDDEWTTVGSSNLDPLSLALNLEANLIVLDRAFNRTLYESLQALSCEHCTEMDHRELGRSAWWRMPLAFLGLRLLRYFPAWADWLPAHTPRLARLRPEAPAKADADRPPQRGQP